MAASRGWVGQLIIWFVLNAIEDLDYDLAVGPWHSLKTNQFSGTLGLLPWQPAEDWLANPSSGGCVMALKKNLGLDDLP